MKQRILVYHPDPWSIGVSCTFVWFTMFDGELTATRKQNYEDKGYVFTYEDVV